MVRLSVVSMYRIKLLSPMIVDSWVSASNFRTKFRFSFVSSSPRRCPLIKSRRDAAVRMHSLEAIVGNSACRLELQYSSSRLRRFHEVLRTCCSLPRQTNSSHVFRMTLMNDEIAKPSLGSSW